VLTTNLFVDLGMTQRADRTALIDYSAGMPTPYVSYAARLPFGGVTLSRCAFPPNPGMTLGSTQVLVAVHTDPAFEMEWRDPGCDSPRRQMINSGEMNVSWADLPVFHRWTTTANALVIALDRVFVERAYMEAFDRHAEPLRVIIGRTDPVVQRLAALCDHEITEGGAGGRLYTESLATALVVHLFRSYGVNPCDAPRMIGGLAPSQLRRVKDLIEARLDEDVSLADLGALTDLSTRHFGQAFKTSVGMPPHRYLIGRRIHRAKELLLNGNNSVAEIAAIVGFASQSHMTFNFRKLAGTTPALYRQKVALNAAFPDDVGEPSTLPGGPSGTKRLPRNI
jgi:AraC family transcriptional regulator